MWGCNKIADLLGAYVYGDLSPEEMRCVRTHVDACGACAKDLETRTRVVGLIPKELPTLSDAERQRVMWSVKGAVKVKEQPKVLRLNTRVLVQGFAVAAVVVAAFLAGATFGPKAEQARVVIREVTPRVRRAAAPKKTRRHHIAQHSGPSINEPIITPNNRIAMAPFRRDRVPETYRRKSERRIPPDPNQVTPTAQPNEPAVQNPNATTSPDEQDTAPVESAPAPAQDPVSTPPNNEPTGE